jgi:hypothetical protein
MAYLFKLRRGVRYVDKNGSTLLNEDGSAVKDDWTTYTSKDNYLCPQEGELVLEYEVNPETGKKIPRLKIGDGESDFANLEYISVDSFILPTQAYVTMYPDKWEPVTDEDGNIIENRYYQYVDVKNAIITPNSKVDLQPTPEQLLVFHEKDLTFTAINAGGQVRVCIVGQKLTNEYTMDATVTEVV